MPAKPYQVEAAAFLVALLQAGLVEEAMSFVEWALENLDLDLDDTFTEQLENIDHA